MNTVLKGTLALAVLVSVAFPVTMPIAQAADVPGDYGSDYVDTSYPTSYTYSGGSDYVDTSYPSYHDSYTPTYSSGGSYSYTSSYTAPKPKPTCTLTVTPTVKYGGNVMMSWSSTNATKATMNAWGGAALSNPGRAFGPLYANKTFVLTVTGPGGSASCRDSVVVQPKVVACPAGTTGTYPHCVVPTPLCPTGTTGTYPNCVVPTPVCSEGTHGNYPNCIVNQVTCPAGMIAGGNNICINNVNNNQNNNQNVNNVVVNVPAPTYQQPTYQYQYPTCTLTASQNFVGYNQPVVLSWSSSNANSGYVSGLGNVSLSGSRTVYPTYTTTYTGTFIGYNGQQVTCSATVTVQNTYVPPPVYQNPVPYVTLSAVPYTGLDLGTMGTALYWSFLVLWCLLAAYLVAVKRVHMSIYRWYSKMLFGSTTTLATAGPAVTYTHATPVVRVATPAQSVDAIDPFIVSQINRQK